MKTKLLKTVRKRYSILKVERLEMNASSQILDFVDNFGLPFYILRDNYSSFYYEGKTSYTCERFSTDYNALLNTLRKWIRQDYCDKFKKKKSRERIVTKVWFK